MTTDEKVEKIIEILDDLFCGINPTAVDEESLDDALDKFGKLKDNAAKNLPA